MSILILTEKPSVAREIAEALGKPQRHEGYLQVDPYLITWAVGHLVSMAPPESYRAEWKSWNVEQLPMIPDSIKLIVNRRTSKQFKVVQQLIQDSMIEKVIFATDAGAEGELIARWIYKKAKGRKDVERLWISSITKEAIHQGMANLRPSSEFDSLYQVATARARADWLIGLNTTRAITCTMRESNSESSTFSVGRVQTPTLHKIVLREREIQSFVPETYYEVVATFEDSNGILYSGKWIDKEKGTSRILKKSQAQRIVDETDGKKTDLVQTSIEEVVIPTPTLPSLSVLQQTMSRKLGVTIARVDEIAQELYEQGLITYPRTADELVPPDVAKTFPDILHRLQGFEHLIPTEIPHLVCHDRYVGPITDHHAIIPTGTSGQHLQGVEKNIYEYICHLFIAAHHHYGVDVQIGVSTRVGKHLFLTKETIVSELGWRIVFGKTKSDSDLTRVTAPVSVTSADYCKLETTPPPRYTEASLVKEMEKHRLGTPATRSGVIEKLKDQEYVLLENRYLKPTSKAETLIDFLNDSILLSPKLTTSWEKQFKLIRSGELKAEEFNHEISQFVSHFVKETVKKTPLEKNNKGRVLGKCPCCQRGSIVKKEKGFQRFYGCSQYVKGCRFFVSGEIASQSITDEDITRLLIKGRTKRKVFNFRNGAQKARLVLKKDGSTSFDYKKNWIDRLGSLFLS